MASVKRHQLKTNAQQNTCRTLLVQRIFPENVMPHLEDNEVLNVLKLFCIGKLSFSELRANVCVDDVVHQLFSYHQILLLNQKAPEKIHLAGRKNVRINYEFGQAPWIASRMQDFFGMKTGPKIADGRVPLVLHLLAPNQRPVQITQDLAGFWERHYPQIRRELSRRYPKHSWLENPLVLADH